MLFYLSKEKLLGSGDITHFPTFNKVISALGLIRREWLLFVNQKGTTRSDVGLFGDIWG